MWDKIMGDDPIEWDNRSYPPLDQPQKLNALAQWKGSMGVSNLGSNGSSSPVFLDFDSVSQYSVPDQSEDSTPPP